MDRLTMTSDKGGVALAFDLDITCKPSEAQKILRLAERVKAYEDTGLTPEEVVELAESKQDGRVVMLPCKVGDDLYWIDDEDKSNPVVRLQKRGVREILLGRNKLWIGDGDCLDEVGTQYCFLTRSEAEAALQNWHEDGVFAPKEDKPCLEGT
jgi:hypothetical protein